MRRFKALKRVAGAAILAASLGVPAAADEMTAKVREMSAAWDAALNAGDAEAVAAMYAQNGKVVTGDGSVKIGRGSIQALFRGFIDSGFGNHHIAVEDVQGTDDLVYMTGTWSGVGGDGKSYGGRLVTIHARQDDGSWETVLHMWN